MPMLDIAILVGSTRPNRKAPHVAEWVHEIASKRTDARYELVDIASFELPLLDEPNMPAEQKYEKEHTKRWAAKIASFDAFVVVTPEYNHGPSAALKNALDYLYREWNDKAVGFVSYGGAGGVRSVEVLRTVFTELGVANIRNQVSLTYANDFENFKTLKPQPRQEKALGQMLDQLVKWGTALKTVRG